MRWYTSVNNSIPVKLLLFDIKKDFWIMIGHRFHNRKRQVESFDTIESAARLPKRRRMRGQKSELNQERSTRRKFTLFLLFSVSLSPVFSVRGKSV